MQYKSQLISGTIALVILILFVVNFSSIYAAGKDFGRTIYEVVSNRK